MKMFGSQWQVLLITSRLGGWGCFLCVLTHKQYFLTQGVHTLHSIAVLQSTVHP